IGVPSSLLLSQAIPAVAILAVCAVLVWSTRRATPLRFSWTEKVRSAASAITRHLSQPTTVQIQLALALAGGLTFAAPLWAVAHSLGTTLTARQAIAFGPAIYLAQVLPFVYFGFGTREAAAVFLLAGYASQYPESAFAIG